MSKIISKNLGQTHKFGINLAKKFNSGQVIGLVGDLGAGKTALSKGLAQGLGIKTTITSPTFVIMKVYPIKNHFGLSQFCHIDAYRLHSFGDLETIGAIEYLQDPKTLTVIEWADRIKSGLPKKTKFIKIKILTGDQREIKI
jgi:tRNA threonylcarbamoyladenosine biosynthesis protein TsaE